jgi:hypothetical protein
MVSMAGKSLQARPVLATRIGGASLAVSSATLASCSSPRAARLSARGVRRPARGGARAARPAWAKPRAAASPSSTLPGGRRRIEVLEGVAGHAAALRLQARSNCAIMVPWPRVTSCGATSISEACDAVLSHALKAAMVAGGCRCVPSLARLRTLRATPAPPPWPPRVDPCPKMLRKSRLRDVAAMSCIHPSG